MEMTLPGPSMTTKQLMDRLQRHYIKPGQPLPGGVFVPEVGWNGGGHLSRVDALFIGFTSASGRLLVGHELKVSRADWRHELDEAGKADPWHDQCHAWYVVAPSTDIVPVEELPDGWGLLTVNPRTTTRLDVKVKARVRLDHTPSWHAVRSIMGRQDTLRATAIDQIRRTADQDARNKIERDAYQAAAHRAQTAGRDAVAALAEIEEAFGCSFTDWRHENRIDPTTFAAAIRLANARRQLTERWGGIDDLLTTLDRGRVGLSDLQKALTDLNSEKEVPHG